MQNVYVWDFPTRLFHWLLAVSIAFQYISAELLDDAMQWHFYVGYFILGLVLFRVIWGFVGHIYSRFNAFICSPTSTINYLIRSNTYVYLSHNPAGAWSVVVLLTIIFTQALSGLFITDDIFLDGPYYSAVSSDVADTANWVHHNIVNALWVFIGIHLIAVVTYQVKGYGLIQSMLHGKKQTSDETPSIMPKGIWWKCVLVATICFVVVYTLVALLPPEPDLYDY
ncbi:MAG: cytochrome b/b6 domain-containing protein [Pseudomonadota bacterium]